MPHLGLFPRDHHRLLFRATLTPNPSSSASSLPAYITRTSINPSSPLQSLELLTASPASFPSSSPLPKKNHTLIFIHGGFGSASVFLPFLAYLSQNHNFTCHAISLRGHGHSWRPGYMEMVFRSGVRDFASDAKFAVQEVGRLEKRKRDQEREQGNENWHPWSEDELVLVGHSAGGGVCQFLMSEMDVKAGGLVLLSSFPNFGGWRVYLNWAFLDPLFLIRFLFRDLMHSRSPLSSTSLVHRAFFSPSYPTTVVAAFEQHMPEYESLLWPMQMMFPFVDVSRVVRNVLGWNVRSEQVSAVGMDEKGMEKEQERILIVAGESDRLMSVDLMERMSYDYAYALGVSRGVGFAVVKGAHHVQNDLGLEECAERIAVFVNQL